MRTSNELQTVYLCREIVDFRKGINGLAILVEQTLERENRELKPANEILRKASAFFAQAELDRKAK